MCEGISQKFKIEHKRKKCKILQIASAAYSIWLFFNFGNMTPELAHIVLIDIGTICEKG